MSETTGTDTDTDAAIDAWVNDIHCGDARETLAELPASSVHMAMMSPPYFGLRDYSVDGQIGLEDSLDEYIGELVAVGDELRRVLRDDGSWWLNLGDSFSTARGSHRTPTNTADDATAGYHDREQATGFQAKQKMLVPHRVAIALQDAGWIVRNDVCWQKPNPMPESVTDRLATTFEFVFHLVPDQDYWYDLDAIREPHAEASLARDQRGRDADEKWADGPAGQSAHSMCGATDAQEVLHPGGKNPGDVFDVTVKPFPDSHFAVYPPELVETPLKATCPPTVCADCGTPYERDVDRAGTPDEPAHRDPDHRLDAGEPGNVDGGRGIGFRHSKLSGQEWAAWKRDNPDEFNGWDQACDCATDETTSGIALDPFAGAGTTCLVAKRLGRRFIGIDLNEDYVAMAQQRVGVTVDQPELLLDADETSLTQFADGGDADD